MFWLGYAPERRAQEQRADEALTLVDALYLSTVVATTLGYGHALWPRTEGAKFFATLYMLGATAVVGGVLGGLANLYLDRKAQDIERKIIESTTWVHKVAE